MREQTGGEEEEGGVGGWATHTHVHAEEDGNSAPMQNVPHTRVLPLLLLWSALRCVVRQGREGVLHTANGSRPGDGVDLIPRCTLLFNAFKINKCFRYQSNGGCSFVCLRYWGSGVWVLPVECCPWVFWVWEGGEGCRARLPAHLRTPMVVTVHPSLQEWTHLRTPMVASLGSVPDRFVCADVFVSSSADQHS